MEYKHIEAKTEDGILLITLNREDKLNALNIALLGEVKHAVERIDIERDLKGVIITGKGQKAFAAGADISEFASFDASQARELSEGGQAIFNMIENCPKPVIAAVNGFALGGGCELAMACHIRLASPNAKFGQPEVNLGIIPGYGGTQRLVQLVGKGKALELMMTGDMIGAEEAHSLGLVNYVYEQDALLPEAKNLINKIAGKGPLAIERVIRSVNDYFRHDIDGFETEVEAFSQSVATQDFKEGTTAFLEKRKANFKGE